MKSIYLLILALIILNLSQLNAATGTLLVPIQMPIIINGKQAGYTNLPKGTQTNIIQENGDKVLIGNPMGSTWIPKTAVELPHGVATITKETPVATTPEPEKTPVATTQTNKFPEGVDQNYNWESTLITENFVFLKVEPRKQQFIENKTSAEVFKVLAYTNKDFKIDGELRKKFASAKFICPEDVANKIKTLGLPALAVEALRPINRITYNVIIQESLKQNLPVIAFPTKSKPEDSTDPFTIIGYNATKDTYIVSDSKKNNIPYEIPISEFYAKTVIINDKNIDGIINYTKCSKIPTPAEVASISHMDGKNNKLVINCTRHTIDTQTTAQSLILTLLNLKHTLFIPYKDTIIRAERSGSNAVSTTSFPSKETKETSVENLVGIITELPNKTFYSKEKEITHTQSPKQIEHTLMLAQNGDPKALVELGNSYRFGNAETEPNEIKAEECYIKANSMESKVALASLYCSRLGFRKVNGQLIDARNNPNNVPRNLAKGLELYQIAINSNYIDAYLDLARLYQTGTEGLEKDDTKAFGLYQDLYNKTVNKTGGIEKSRYTVAVENLATMMIQGKGTTQNIAKAKELLDKCIKDGVDNATIRKLLKKTEQ